MVSTGSPTPHAHGRLDGCPECLVRGNTPTSTTPLVDGYRCTYTCHTCGFRWWTSWAADVID